MEEGSTERPTLVHIPDNDVVEDILDSGISSSIPEGNTILTVMSPNEGDDSVDEVDELFVDSLSLRNINACGQNGMAWVPAIIDNLRSTVVTLRESVVQQVDMNGVFSDHGSGYRVSAGECQD